MELPVDDKKTSEEEDNYEYDGRRNDIAVEQKKFEAPFGKSINLKIMSREINFWYQYCCSILRALG